MASSFPENSSEFPNGGEQVVSKTAKNVTAAAGADRVVRLTQAVVAGLVAGKRRTIVWDDTLKGFGIRLEASGRKFFLLRYRAYGGGRRARAAK